MADCVIGRFKVHVEVPLLLLFFSFMFSDSVKTNLMIYRTCYVTLGYNKSECALLGSKYSTNETTNLEKIVEPYASVINMVNSITEACFCGVICLFIGPWSDRFGRKPILLIPLVGFSIHYVFLAIFAALSTISPWYSLLSSVPVMLSGGFSSYLTVVLCYVADVTSESNRGMRMGIFEGVLSLGILIGDLSSSYAFYALGYSAVFLISAACCFFAALFTAFFIPESVINRESEDSIRGFFQISNVGDMLKTTFKRRRAYERCTLLCCIVILTLYILAIGADGSVIFLYLREKLNWSLEKYTLYSAAHNVAWILGTIIGVYILHKLMGIPETILILVGFISLLNSSLLQGLATNDIEIYAGGIVRSLGAVLSPMIRSLVTKIVPAEEIGKVFSLIVTSESLFGMLGSPFYTFVYNSTIQTNPSVFNFITAGIYTIEILISIGVILMRTLKPSQECDELLINEEVEKDDEEGTSR